MKESDVRQMIKEEIKNVITEDDFEMSGHGLFPEGDRVDRYLFTVENTQEGLGRIRRAKEALSSIFKFQLRGRHHDRKEVLGDKWRAGKQNDIPVRDAEYIAVYVDPK